MEPTLKPKRTKSPQEALSALMRLCARAEKSSGDARRLMRGWGIAPPEAEKILQELIRQRFIDDARYTSAFIREKCALNGWGVFKIKEALRRKEIDHRLIDQALAAMDRKAGEEKLLIQLARKERTLKAANNFEKRAKLIRYGLSLGHEYEVVSETVSHLMKISDEECDTFYP